MELALELPPLRVELPPTLVAAVPLMMAVEPPVATVIEAVAEADNEVDVDTLVDEGVLAADAEEPSAEEDCEDDGESQVSGTEELLTGHCCALAKPDVRAVVARTLKYFILLTVAGCRTTTRSSEGRLEYERLTSQTSRRWCRRLPIANYCI